jgi:hypothetical protein|tara:strand:+ start:130 stop:1134 length:1005 start_codon:yes stop_codon:yes gene_type:complete
MAVNSIFHTSNVAALATEQNLYRDLVVESIQIYGHDVHYLDRTLVNEDSILGTDNLAKFITQAKIEMYMEDSEGGFAGEKELMGQFGLQNLSEATFVVAKERFQDLTKQITIESGTDTLGGSILLEDGTLDSGTVEASASFESGYLISEATSTNSDRPLEGDLIFHPILSKLFQINFVDHDEPYFQLDNNPVYKLRCRLFEYSSEILDTDITAIDVIEDNLSTDTLALQFTMEQDSATIDALLLESGFGRIIHEDDANDEVVALETSDMTTSAGVLLGEDSGFLLQEDYIIGDGSTTADGNVDTSAQNELFDDADNSVLDFTETNPFGDVGGSS